MRIREVTLQEVRMKLVAPFETSMDRTDVRRILLVQADVDGVIGWAECVAGEAPFYSPETADTAWLMLRDFLWPLIKEKDFSSADQVWDLLARVRGHNMAKGSLEAAVWDAEAKQKGVPLARLIGGVREEIACGVSIGIKESLDELAAAVQKELAAGYQRIKIKIKPGKDLEPVRRLRQDFPRIKLMVDANSAYTLDDWALLKQLEGFYLMMIEQPLGWAVPAAILWRGASTTSANGMAFPSGAAGCSNPESAARTISRFRRSLISRSPAMWPPASAIGRKTSSFLRSPCHHKARFACRLAPA